MQEKSLLENLPRELLLSILFLSGDSRYFFRFVQLSRTMKFMIDAGSNKTIKQNLYWFQLYQRQFLLSKNDDTKYNPQLSYRTLYKENADEYNKKNSKLTKDQRELFRCISANDLETIAQLESDLPGNLDVLDHQNRTPVTLAGLYGQNEILRFFYDQICSKIFSKVEKDDQGRTKFYWAAACNIVSEISSTRDSVIINAAQNNGATPLYIAAQNGHIEVVAALINAGANKDQARNEGATPLFIAAQNGHIEVVAALINAGANKDQAMNSGATPLYIAAQNGHIEVVAALINAGANKDQAMNERVTPLFIAAHNGHLKVVAALINAGANKDQAAIDGDTPISIAKARNQQKVFAFLTMWNVSQESHKNTLDKIIAVLEKHITLEPIALTAIKKAKTWFFSEDPLTSFIRELKDKSANQNDVNKENLITLIKSKKDIIPLEKYDFILKNILEVADNLLELDSQKSLNYVIH
ncbi:MAG: ankyrin repeat domain-containing protein [Gammaproteobacteria bacterium]|nr:ankyrin repeat domain-containing protein [Gammaproteobacteria bacterium]